jgi:heme-degrading monooxygenase HmoA
VYARTTSLEIDTLRISVDDALDVFKADVLPRLRTLPGFEGVFALSTAEGKAMLVSFWDTADHADAGEESAWYSGVLDEYTTFFRSPPGRQHYEVRMAIPPSVIEAVR